MLGSGPRTFSFRGALKELLTPKKTGKEEPDVVTVPPPIDTPPQLKYTPFNYTPPQLNHTPDPPQLSYSITEFESQGSLLDHNVDLIGSATSIEEIINALAKRGCPNLTSMINPDACSDFPFAGGGFCDVYQGALYDGTRIAIKSLRVYDGPEAKGDGDKAKLLKRAARELYLWSKLQHPNVLPLMGLTVFRRYISMVSPWMENGSLPSYLRFNPSANKMKLCVDISEGLCYIHMNGMFHGDLKAANIMVSSNGTAMVADFGNAQLKDLTLKFTNTTKGGLSVRWAAPELLLADGGPQMSKEADVYAYGMTALETLTGEAPYEGISDNRVICLVAYEQKVPSRPDIDIGDDLWDLLNSCWVREPSKRPGIATVSDRLKSLILPASYTGGDRYEEVRNKHNERPTPANQTQHSPPLANGNKVPLPLAPSQSSQDQTHKEAHMGMRGMAPTHTGPAMGPMGGMGMGRPISQDNGRSIEGGTGGGRSIGKNGQRAASPSTPFMSNAVPPGGGGAAPGVGNEAPGNYAYKARALYAYTASPDDPAEISFAKGENLGIVDNIGKWWQARKEDGTTGIVPSNFFQLVSKPPHAVSPPGVGVDNDPEAAGIYAYKARALYAYTANPDDPAEVSFARGEIMGVMDYNGKWWQVWKEDGTTGIAPSNYLLLI